MQSKKLLQAKDASRLVCCWIATLCSTNQARKQWKRRTMSWLQISRGPLGCFQTLCLISSLITHACIRSATLPLLYLPAYERNPKITFCCLRLFLIWRLERLCRNSRGLLKKNELRGLTFRYWKYECCVALCVEVGCHVDMREFPLMGFQDLLLNSF